MANPMTSPEDGNCRRRGVRKFINAGGLLVTLGSASFFPPEFGLTRTIDAGRTSPQFYGPGPIVEAEILQAGHPLFYGYSQKTVRVRYANGPLLQVPERDRGSQVLMRFPGGDKSVLSGLMKGASEIRNRPADCRRAGRTWPRAAVLNEPLLSMAELRRVQHAVQRGVEFQRHQDCAEEA